MRILRFERGLQRAGDDGAEFCEHVARAAAVRQPVEGEPDAVRRRHVVAVADVAGFEADGRRGALAEGLIGKLRHGIHRPDDLGADAVGARAVEGIAGMGRPADDEGEGRELADGAEIDRTAFLAVALAARRVEIDAGDDIEVEAPGNPWQGVAQAAHAARAVFLVGRRDEEDVAVRRIEPGKALHRGDSRRKAALHVEKAAAGDEGAAFEIPERLFLRAVSRAAAKLFEERLHQRFRIAGERRERAVVGDRDRVEMTGQHHRLPPRAAHQRDDVPRQRLAVAVDGEELAGVALEIRGFGQKRVQPPGKIRLVGRARHARPARHCEGEILRSRGGDADCGIVCHGRPVGTVAPMGRG